MSAILEIEKTVNWYRSIKTDFTDTDTLLRTQRHLAGLLFAFAAELGQLYRQKNGSEFQRKAAFARARQAGINNNESAAKAEAANSVKDRMSQRISNLKSYRDAVLRGANPNFPEK